MVVLANAFLLMYNLGITRDGSILKRLASLRLGVQNYSFMI